MSFCRLLTLSRRDFRRLTAADPDMEKIIRLAAERQRGAALRARSATFQLRPRAGMGHPFHPFLVIVGNGGIGDDRRAIRRDIR